MARRQSIPFHRKNFWLSRDCSPLTIANGTQFRDTAGNVVHAHGGGVLKVGTYYYWFGENRNADNTFRAVSVYRSTDLVTWEFRNNVLTQSSAAELASANIERPKVIYNASTGRYVMWMHKESASDYSQARAAVASSATVDGAYTTTAASGRWATCPGTSRSTTTTAPRT
jgi:beta-xylosidase